MKILISLSYYDPHISGLTLYAKKLAEAFAKRGNEVAVVTARHDNRLLLDDAIDGVHIIRLPVLVYIAKGPIMPAFLRQGILLVRDADVVNCHLPQFESSLIALIAKFFGKKLIITYHTDIATGKSITKRVIKYVLTLSQYITCLLADKIVVQTEDNADHSLFLHHFQNKLAYIYPPIFPPTLVKQEVSSLASKIKKHTKYTIGFLGRMASEKGIEYLLEYKPLLQKEFGDAFIIVLAGPKKTVGEGVYEKRIEILLQKYSSHVVQVGELSEKQLGAFYSLLDVFVLPSINNTEAFGMVQVEAMFCGTPVVATDLPGVRVPIRETGMGEIIQPRDSTSLAQAVIKILKDKKKYVKNRLTIEHLFSLEKVIEAYQKLFTS
jgi:glycosyltransferase involved in cell wall biosynthesis